MPLVSHLPLNSKYGVNDLLDALTIKSGQSPHVDSSGLYLDGTNAIHFNETFLDILGRNGNSGFTIGFWFKADGDFPDSLTELISDGDEHTGIHIKFGYKTRSAGTYVRFSSKIKRTSPTWGHINVDMNYQPDHWSVELNDWNHYIFTAEPFEDEGDGLKRNNKALRINGITRQEIPNASGTYTGYVFENSAYPFRLGGSGGLKGWLRQLMIYDSYTYYTSSSELMYPKVCTCENGTVATGSDCDVHNSNVCTECDTGYTLDGYRNCEPNQCTCENGTAATGSDCDVHNSYVCSICDAGYHIDGNHCEPNQCTCENGTAATGSDCNVDASNICSVCDAGYTLLNGVCNIDGNSTMDGSDNEPENDSNYIFIIIAIIVVIIIMVLLWLNKGKIFKQNKPPRVQYPLVRKLRYI